MKTNSDKVMLGKLFEMKEDGDDFTYLLKIINLTDDFISCNSVTLKRGLVRHSDSINGKFKRIEAQECQRIRMRKANEYNKTLSKLSANKIKNHGANEEAVENHQAEELMILDPHKKSSKNMTDQEELKGVVTYKLFGDLLDICFDIAFSNKSDGTNNILIESSSKDNSCINRVNKKEYEKHLSSEKYELIKDVFIEGNYSIFRIENDNLKQPLLIKYGVTSAKPKEELLITQETTKEKEEEKKLENELSLLTISERDAVAVVIIDLDHDRIKTKEEEQKAGVNLA